MAKNKWIVIFIVLLACLLVVIGWLGYHQQKAVTEITKLKTDLMEAKSELLKVMQTRDKLEEDITKLTKERNDVASQIKVAQATIDTLKTQLNDQIAKAGGLQAIIDQLENKLKKETKEVVNSKLLGIVLTTGWNKEDKSPENDLKEISINEKVLYAFCKWRLSLENHTYTIKIFNESKQLIYEKKNDLKPTEPFWNTWPGYYINEYIDKPGRWTVEIYLDGRKVGEKSINVLAEAKTDVVKVTTKCVTNWNKAYSIKYNPSKWLLETENDNQNSEYEFEHILGDAYAMVIYERTPIPLDLLKDIVIKNAEEEATPVQILDTNEIKIGNQTILRMKYEVLISSIPFVYYAHLCSNDQGTLQFIAFSHKNLFDEYEDDFNALFDGLTFDQLENKSKKEAEEVVDSRLLRMVLTTGLTEKGKMPVNDLEEISINEKIIYVFCKWSLSLKGHTYTIKIFDEAKQIIHENEDELKPTSRTWLTRPGYYINEHIDTPGRWTVEVYLDGRKVGEKSINVLPEIETDLSDSVEAMN